MTTSLNNYKNSIYSTNENDFYNGVARVTNGYSYGTGSLLYDGNSILTAAHIFEDYSDKNIRVYFDTFSGYKSYNATLNIYSDYDPINLTGDLAILSLEENPSSNYQRYDLYRSKNEINQDFTMVGYGSYGSGYTGELFDREDILKLKTKNTFEAEFYDIYNASGVNLAWIPKKGSTLAADFDSAYRQNDALGNILGKYDLGVGDLEGMIASGDSGGPAFIDNSIAGIASYSASIESYYNDTDINGIIDSSFGEIGAWQRVSTYSEWIDKTIRKEYKNAPKSAEEVEKFIVESDDEIQYVYFFLEYTEDRSLINDSITLNYATRDGSATKGEDYIAVSGVIALYSDESSVVIPVEILGDTEVEEDETFYLDVTNPSHGSFGDEIVTLTAARTIIDNDFYIA